jgi:hypothetical protein
MNKGGLISPHPELTKAGKAIAALKLVIADRRRGIKKRKKKRTAAGRENS